MNALKRDTPEKKEPPVSPGMRLGVVLLKLGLAIGLSTVFIYLLLHYVSLETLVLQVSSASPELVFLSLSLVVLGQLARGWRVGIMATQGLIPTFKAYRISTLHSFFASALPARLGEAALPLMLKTTYGTSIASGSIILLAVRILDLLIILSVCGLTFWIVVPSGSVLEPLRGIGLLGGGLSLSLYIGLPWLRQICARIAVSPMLHSKGKVVDLMVRMLMAISVIEPQKFFFAQISTLAIWISLFGAYYLAALSISSFIPLDATLLASTLGSIAFVLPVNGIAQIGPFEAAWTYGAGLGGISAGKALPAAVMIHAVTFAGGLLQAVFVTLVNIGRCRRGIAV